MDQEEIALFGIPISSLDSAQIVERVLDLIKKHTNDKPINYISTANADFLYHVHGWGWRQFKRPELMNLFLNSKFVTADGMPLVWLSKWLGNPLKVRVAGADLVPLLAEALGEQGGKIFLFGGEQSIAKKAAKHLEKVNPGLKVVGIACPQVDIEGEGLQGALERDAILAEEINESAPDVLLISLGHPKQEIWCERIRKHLNIPIAIGIGGTLNFLTGKVKRAPLWMQNFGLEWLYRLSQEPKRLIFRYSLDIANFLYLSLPLLVAHYLNTFLTRSIQDGAIKPLLFLSEKRSIAAIRMPSVVNKSNAFEVREAIENALAQDSAVLDCERMRHIDLAGMRVLIRALQKARESHKPILLLKLRWNLRVLLHLHRVWPLFSSHLCDSPGEILSRLGNSGEYCHHFEAIHQKEDSIVLSFFGDLCQEQHLEMKLEKLTSQFHGKDCVIDFSYSSEIDNAGICFLLKLKQMIEYQGKKLTVRGLNRTIRKQLKLAKIAPFLHREELK